MHKTWMILGLLVVCFTSVLVLVGCEDKGGKGGGRSAFKKELPEGVIENVEYDNGQLPGSDDCFNLTVRNVGAAGKLRVWLEIWDEAGRNVLSRSSTLVYLEKGGEKRLRFNVGNLHFARVRAKPWATPED